MTLIGVRGAFELLGVARVNGGGGGEWFAVAVLCEKDSG